jgi:raffinose/stachyose/melibiose transport system permease protein
MSATTSVRAKPNSRRIDPLRVGIWLALLVAAIIWMIPFILMIFTSLKTNAEINSGSSFALPLDPAWNNYPDALKRGGFAGSIVNSLVISLIKVPLGLIIAALAAFALARLRFRWQKLVLALIVMGTMVPIQVAIAPVFRIILNMGLLNSTAGLLLPYIAFGIPFQVFVLYGFFRAIPFELDEAAKIDGASTLGLFWKVILPLARPALGALFILDFVATWNEFSIAVAILHDQRAYTVPLALQNFNSQYQSAYGQLNAAIVMSIVPVLIVFLLFQRSFVSGAFSGAVKG